ncbi:MAG: hypothetical protein RLZZ361_914 [Cyanobacteriota bacterium]|jgi:choline kinase
MSSAKIAIIAAAGIGSRLGFNLPKCLVRIGDYPIIKYQLDLLKDFDQVRIVVGFKAEEVIKVAKDIRKDIIFVHNKHYYETGNIYSAHLGSQDLKEPFFFIDGDLIISSKSFSKFVNFSKRNKQTVIGISTAKTQEAVFVKTDKNLNILGFSSNPQYDYEWAGVAYFHNLNFHNQNDGFIYKVFEPLLPLKGFNLDLFEIDTPDDYQFALGHFKDLLKNC